MSINESSKLSKVWLFSKTLDLLVLYLPIWAIWIICFLLNAEIKDASIPTWLWVVFVLGIDVTHVWSSLFRTYSNKQAFKNNKKLFVFTPILCFVTLLIINVYFSSFFWSILAYLALYHFIKQQVGFLSFYKNKNNDYSDHKILTDKRIIYFSMLYPVIYWHLNSSLNFNWFTENDFFTIGEHLNIKAYLYISNCIYWLVIIYWIIQEIKTQVQRNNSIPYGKLLWVGSTSINWYLGIVFFNSDIVFTLTNVVAHGIPYIALIIIHVIREEKSKDKPQKSNKKILISKILATIIILAFIEEYLWSMFVNREQINFFTSIIQLPIEQIQSETLLAIAIAILSLPQVTHYVLDGYIWRPNSKNPSIKKTIISYRHE